ncbi:putative protein N(5)-glutamine methyltransferase, partial [Streptomyces anulatus]
AAGAGGGAAIYNWPRSPAHAPLGPAPGASRLVVARPRQRDTAVEVLRAAGLSPRVLVSEELYATVLVGTAPAGAAEHLGFSPWGDPVTAPDPTPHD